MERATQNFCFLLHKQSNFVYRVVKINNIQIQTHIFMQTRFSRYATFRLLKAKCKHAHIGKAKINVINNKTQHYLIWFVFYVCQFSSHIHHSGFGCCCCCSCSCFFFFFSFLYYALAWPLFFFLFFHICVRMLVCVVTLPPFWHSQQQPERIIRKERRDNFRNSKMRARAHHTVYRTHVRKKRVREWKKQNSQHRVVPFAHTSGFKIVFDKRDIKENSFRDLD